MVYCLSLNLSHFTSHKGNGVRSFTCIQGARTPTMHIEHDCIFLFQTYIGSILAAVNPYREIKGFYTTDIMTEYSKYHLGEKPPHIFAIANECYYSMVKKGQSQCVLIR